MDAIRAILVRVLWIFTLIVSFFLVFRIILGLFGANPSSPFAAIIYAVSSLFLLPFANLFPRPDLPGNAFIDTVAITALVAYITLFFLAMLLIYIIFNIFKRLDDRQTA